MLRALLTASKYNGGVYLKKGILIFYIACISFILTSCSFSLIPKSNSANPLKIIKDKIVKKVPKEDFINTGGKTIGERFKLPKGFERTEVAQGSFQEYLRSLPLKPQGTKVKLYDGKIKTQDVYDAVVDMDIGDRDLEQCADAVMRLRAEYLYKKGLYDKIHFNFVCGFNAEYSKWMQGYRISVKGNSASWMKSAAPSNDYKSFRQYLDMVFAYAGTESLAKEMEKVSLSEMNIGDVFIKGPLPGHTVIVVDMAENKATGEKLFMLAQSYTPAQDIQILKNQNDINISPWYCVNFGDKLVTPQWKFSKEQIERFRE